MPALALAQSSGHISTSTFAEELFYADGPGTALYNGNISSIRWKDNTSSSKRGYKFTYDPAHRLISGVYGEGDALSSNTGRYSESMSYDANGSLVADKSRGIAYITYDYGARQHDPILARWDRIDPLCEVITKHRIR